VGQRRYASSKAWNDATGKNRLSAAVPNCVVPQVGLYRAGRVLMPSVRARSVPMSTAAQWSTTHGRPSGPGAQNRQKRSPVRAALAWGGLERHAGPGQRSVEGQTALSGRRIPRIVEGCIVREGAVLGWAFNIGSRQKCLDARTGVSLYGKSPQGRVVCGKGPCVKERLCQLYWRRQCVKAR